MSRVKSRVADFWAKNGTLLLGCPGQFPNIFFLKTFLPPRANPKKNFLSQHSIQGKSKKNTFITTFHPGQFQKEYFYHNLPSIQGSSKSNIVFLLQPSFQCRAVPKRILLSYNLPSIQGSSKRNTFITTFLPSREVPRQFHEIRKLFLISKKIWICVSSRCAIRNGP